MCFKLTAVKVNWFNLTVIKGISAPKVYACPTALEKNTGGVGSFFRNN